MKPRLIHLKSWMLLVLFLVPSCATMGAGDAGRINGSTAVIDSLHNAFDEIAAVSRVHDGLFPLYQDTLTGSLHIVIRPEHLGKEFIVLTTTVDGVPAAGHFRGDYRDYRVLSVRKALGRIELAIENTRFHYEPASSLSRASEANISPAVLGVYGIEGVNRSSGEYLIRADNLFLTETLHQVKRTPDPEAVPGESFTLGDLNAAKTRYVTVRNYPLNTDVIVEYVYENPYPPGDQWTPEDPLRGGREVTDPRFVSIRMQHSLIAMPENDYKPRFDDPRVGYFAVTQTDLTSTSATPYRDLIERWNLMKQDPTATLSEPVEPITWWIENTTPLEYREIIRNAALAWNEAFEGAGYRNAIRVEIQPDDAEWDAGDIRYNVIRWASSPTPQFWGYGPSFSNPRTGQLIGADIMLEWVSVTQTLLNQKLFDSAALDLVDPTSVQDPRLCSLGRGLQRATLFGARVIDARGGTEEEKDRLLKSMLYFLVLHEVGHTLGLTHNMMSSQMLTPIELQDRSITESLGVTGSVMEYPALNVSPKGAPQADFYTMRPGPYDLWAIEYGYSSGLSDEATERERLEGILERSTEPRLAFGNDADMMAEPGHAIDPRVMVWDMSSDPIGYAVERIVLANELLQDLTRTIPQPGGSYHELRNAFLVVTGEIGAAANVLSRYPGGVYVDRAMVGQPGGSRPFVPVPRAEQVRAMEALEQHVFAPDAFMASADLYGRLQMQRRGFEHMAMTEDPKIHERALTIQRAVLDHLLHPVVLKRVSDTQLYGNEYSLIELMSDLTSAIFAGEQRGWVNSFRQNLQAEYVERLAKILREEEDNEYDHLTRSVAMANLVSIRGLLTVQRSGDAATQAHVQHLLFLIGRALDPRRAGGSAVD